MAENVFKKIDWILVFFILPIVLAGLFTMKSFSPLEDGGTFFNKQSASAIRYAVAHFKRDKYNLEDRRKTLSQFSKNTFISTIRNVI